MVKTAVLVSGGGTNLQAILDARDRGEIKNCDIAVVSSNPDAYALKRAELAGVPSIAVNRKLYADRNAFTDAILRALEDFGAELAVLAGFNFALAPQAVEAYRNRIINVHPALIPAFCGMGYYGLRVHEEVLRYGAKVSGATAHFVTEEVDAGPVILQKAVEVLQDDTPESLQRRVMEQAEWIILPRAVSLFCEGRLEINGRIVKILGGVDI